MSLLNQIDEISEKIPYENALAGKYKTAYHDWCFATVHKAAENDFESGYKKYIDAKKRLESFSMPSDLIHPILGNARVDMGFFISAAFNLSSQTTLTIPALQKFTEAEGFGYGLMPGRIIQNHAHLGSIGQHISGGVIVNYGRLDFPIWSQGFGSPQQMVLVNYGKLCQGNDLRSLENSVVLQKNSERADYCMMQKMLIISNGPCKFSGGSEITCFTNEFSCLERVTATSYSPYDPRFKDYLAEINTLFTEPSAEKLMQRFGVMDAKSIRKKMLEEIKGCYESP